MATRRESARLLQGRLPPELARRLEPLAVLGPGGMGVVARARDRSLGREVALEVALDAVSVESRGRFAREGPIAGGQLAAWDGVVASRGAPAQKQARSAVPARWPATLDLRDALPCAVAPVPW